MQSLAVCTKQYKQLPMGIDNISKTTEAPISQKRLRKICWDIGTAYPPAFYFDQIGLSFIHPHQGFIQWHIREDSVTALQSELGDKSHGANMIIRVYNVTNVIFNGYNAHDFYDVMVHSRQGNYYVQVDQLGRNLMVEIGLRLNDGKFLGFARSMPVLFDRDHSSGNFQSGGLYVGRGFEPVLGVDNIFDANVYERLNRELIGSKRKAKLNIASVSMSWAEGFNEVVNRIGDAMFKLGPKSTHFGLRAGEAGPKEDEDLTMYVASHSQDVYLELEKAHTKKPFDMLHCHDWVSLPVALKAQKKLGLPLMFFLHSTEHERAYGRELDESSKAICQLESEGIHAADLVVVPRSSTHKQVVEIYRGDKDRVTIVHDAQDPIMLGAEVDRGEIMSTVRLNPEQPMILYCGEMSHAGGADLLVEAMPHLCGEVGTLQFVFAGDGPLRRELENRVNGMGLGHRVRFVGDAQQSFFQSLLNACDFVVIPARTWQDEGLAQLAIDAGKAVLVTHQSHIKCISHGQNGLITYDNPGSVIWGIKEMLANPISGHRRHAPQRHSSNVSIAQIAIEIVISGEGLMSNREQ